MSGTKKCTASRSLTFSFFLTHTHLALGMHAKHRTWANVLRKGKNTGIHCKNSSTRAVDSFEGREKNHWGCILWDSSMDLYLQIHRHTHIQTLIVKARCEFESSQKCKRNNGMRTHVQIEWGKEMAQRAREKLKEKERRKRERERVNYCYLFFLVSVRLSLSLSFSLSLCFLSCTCNVHKRK